MRTKTQNFKIVGMHCVSCAMNIDFDLEDLPGVVKSQTNYAQQTLKVEFDPDKVSARQILEQIKKTGYEAEDLLH